MKSREEAKSKGIPLSPTKHNMSRRAAFHDYSGRSLYMITLVTLGRKPHLGRLVCEPYPNVELSQLGHQMNSDLFKKIPVYYPNVEVWKVMVMPDHVHFILWVHEPFTEGKSLSDVIRGFKIGCNKAYREILGLNEGSLFETGFNDRIILPGKELENWVHYLDDNPRRLAMKRQHPDLFTVIRDIEVCGKKCQMIGNMFLLQIPQKRAVIVHSKDSDEDFGRLKSRWLAFAENGGVLVSAAIAPREREVIREAMMHGYAVIYLRHNGFAPLHKPSGLAFDSCANGTYLLLSPFPFDPDFKKPSRSQCLDLNRFAEAIAAGTDAPPRRCPGTVLI